MINIDTSTIKINVNIDKELITVKTSEKTNSRFYKKIIDLILTDRRVNPIDIFDFEIKTEKIC